MREKSGGTEFFHHQGNTEFYLKVRKKSGNFYYFRVATWFGKGKVMLFQKAATKELISATSSLALLGKNLFSVVSAKSGKTREIFIILISDNTYL